MNMDLEEAKERYSRLVERILLCDREYAVGQPSVSDDVYDSLVTEATRIGNEFGFNDQSSTVSFWKDVEFSSTFPHRYPMLSIDNIIPNVKDDGSEALSKWLTDVVTQLGNEDVVLVGQLKYDGIACSVELWRRVNGEYLVERVMTRHDGVNGSDITSRAAEVLSLQRYLACMVQDYEVVRGELILFRRDLDKMRELTGYPYANTRNAAAGIVQSGGVGLSYLTFMPYYGFDDRGGQHLIGPRVIDELVLKGDLSNLAEVVDVLTQYRNDLATKRVEESPFDYDGLVISVLDPYQRRTLGYSRRAPRWAIAYKFRPEEVTTRIVSITDQVSRLGTVTPVLNLEPVAVAGVTVSNINGDNYDLLAERGLGVGAEVVIGRNGDVIPRVQQVLTPAPVAEPTQCPSCGSRLQRVGSFLRCHNSYGCPAQMAEVIVHLGSRGCLDIDDLGPKIAEAIVHTYDKPMLQLFDMSAEALNLAYQRINGSSAMTSIEKVLSQLADKPSYTVDRVLRALGIRSLGNRASEDIARRLTWVELIGDRETAIAAIRKLGLGDVTTEQIVSGLIEYGFDVLQYWSQHLTIEDVVVKTGVNAPQSGQVVCLSGSMEPYTKPVLESVLKALGAEISSDVSKRTTLLIAGPGSGSKSAKAQKLGIPILTPTDALVHVAGMQDMVATLQKGQS